MGVNPGNAAAHVPFLSLSGVVPGFDYCSWEGSAGITAQPNTSWQIFNALDEEAILPASLSEPLWIVATSFDLSVAFQGAVGARLKLATSAGDSNPYVSQSKAVDGGGFLQIEDNIRSTQPPFSAIQITSPQTFRLYLVGGAALIPAPASPTVITNPSPIPLTTVRVPIRIEFLRRSEAPDRVDLSPIQNRQDLGLPLI